MVQLLRILERIIKERIMKLFPALEKKYSSEDKTAQQALRRAHEITFGPVVFQTSRLMVKFGILQMLLD